MKKFAKTFTAFALAAVIGVSLASCGVKDNFPPADYTPTDIEANFISGLSGNDSIATHKSKVALINNEDGLTNVIEEKADDYVVVITSLPVIGSEKNYNVKFTWGVVDPMFSDKITFVEDDAKGFLRTELVFPEFDPTIIEGLPKEDPQYQERYIFDIFTEWTFGKESGRIEYTLELVPGELPEKLMVSDIYDRVAAHPPGEPNAPWANTRVEITAKVFDHFSDKDPEQSYGFRAGIFVHDTAGTPIALYAQNNNDGAGKFSTVLVAEIQAQNIKKGDVAVFRGSVVAYNGMIQLNGISYVSKVTDEAVLKTFTTTPKNIAMTDELYASIDSTGGTGENYKAFVKDYMHHPFVYNSLRYKSGTVNRGTTNAETGKWAGGRSVIIFTNGAGKDVRLHVNYHVGPEVVGAIADLIDVAAAGDAFNLNGLLSYSGTGIELIIMNTNGIAKA